MTKFIATVSVETKKIINEEETSLPSVWKTFNSYAVPLSNQLHCSNLRTCTVLDLFFKVRFPLVAISLNHWLFSIKFSFLFADSRASGRSRKKVKFRRIFRDKFAEKRSYSVYSGSITQYEIVLFKQA